MTQDTQSIFPKLNISPVRKITLPTQFMLSDELSPKVSLIMSKRCEKLRNKRNNHNRSVNLRAFKSQHKQTQRDRSSGKWVNHSMDIGFSRIQNVDRVNIMSND